LPFCDSSHDPDIISEVGGGRGIGGSGDEAGGEVRGAVDVSEIFRIVTFSGRGTAGPDFN